MKNESKLNTILDLITKSEARRIYYNLFRHVGFKTWTMFDAEFDSLWNGLSGGETSSYSDTVDRSIFMDQVKIKEDQIQHNQESLKKLKAHLSKK